jgi:hypothetical protein
MNKSIKVEPRTWTYLQEAKKPGETMDVCINRLLTEMRNRNEIF